MNIDLLDEARALLARAVDNRPRNASVHAASLHEAQTAALVDIAGSLRALAHHFAGADV